jgi:hypothetical protein
LVPNVEAWGVLACGWDLKFDASEGPRLPHSNLGVLSHMHDLLVHRMHLCKETATICLVEET